MTTNLKSLSTAALWKQFRNAFNHTVEGIRMMAEAYVELMERGEDLSSYKNDIFCFLPDVASGKLSAEALLKFGGEVKLLEAVRMTVPEVQKTLVNTDSVNVLTKKADGSTETKAVKLTDLSAAQIRQVFCKEGIRSTRDQRHYMSERATKTAAISRSSFNLWDELSEAQRVQLVNAAGELNMEPMAFVKSFLIQYDVISAEERRVYKSRRASPEQSSAHVSV